MLAREKERWKHPPFFIEPTERLRGSENSTRGVLATIPEIACVARFSSLQPARNGNADASELVILWFQHEFAFPIASDVMAALEAIPWEAHALDFEW